MRRIGLMTLLGLLMAGCAFAQWPRPVTTAGTVSSNDVVVFADHTGKSIKSGGLNGTVSNRPDYISVPFIATNATYEVIRFGPWDEDRTLQWVQAWIDSGTCVVDVCEVATNAGVRATTATNVTVVATSASAKTTNFADAVINAGKCLLLNLRGTITGTNGYVQIHDHY